MRTIIAAAALALLACSDALAPVFIGDPYYLRTINGQPLPWSTPPADSEYIPTTIIDGSVTFLSDSLAERYESSGRWVLTPSGDSTWLSSVWNQIAVYRRGTSSIVLTYPLFTPRRDWSVSPSGNTVRDGRRRADAPRDRSRPAARQHYSSVLQDKLLRRVRKVDSLTPFRARVFAEPALQRTVKPTVLHLSSRFPDPSSRFSKTVA